ncbi:flavodoxin domain-containing protein [Nocardiopsis aegyptia]|uniref:Menaquinone-dependent protoporphyrinogen oxidase n=1 Tax=Nocardiopsis aegyptia TaxID=220378 RepID=A0A7Z0ELW0_9ACTN|nr:flavodoxin domain-containing protein [Nocardiopsis aegyptia]NYJ34507.1 menaquinone-dependent protoporphyrinogen oxidase [Nocardiopsis aegyptia]
MTVLVGYASQHGSTREIAQRIAARLRERGHTVDVRSLGEAPALGGYEAAVLGSAVHSGSWLPDASDYVRAATAPDGRMPVWAFSVGLARVVGGWFEKYAQESEEVARLRETTDLREHRLLKGALSPEHLPLFGRAAYRIMGEVRRLP